MSPSLSIAIPVYNQDVSVLVSSLQEQIERSSAQVEILLFDDGSDDSFKKLNRQYQAIAGINYQEQPTNIGRAAIRNRLASCAKAKHVLFLDGDTVVAEKEFITTYLKQIEQSPQAVICGGRNYHSAKPSSEYLLHWTYGRNRESKNASHRKVSPYKGFHSNNFSIPKDVWSHTPFDESLKQYGHEDTLMGYGLMLQKVPIVHIDNATIHGQLEDNHEFLVKTKLALNNLKLLSDRGSKEFNQWQYMLNRYQTIKSFGLRLPIGAMFSLMHRTWEKQLTKGKEPSLKVFNWYRFGYLCRL